MKPKLLIGMACFDDYDGVYFTIQALRMYHDLREVELAVVDNNPGSAHGNAVKDFLGWIKGDVAGVHYVDLVGVTGTAAPRQKLFEIGDAPAVCVVDPHVLLVEGAVTGLLDCFEDDRETNDLYQGPMLYDDLKNYSTHFEDVWGDDQMWGKWGTDRRAESGEAFEIPAMGLGLFACRREAWLGFNPRFRGFGGEEWYIHEKFRQAGCKVMCLPAVRWLHRFGRPGGVRYKLDIWDKARNYVIGLTELGIPLDRARASFVDSGKIKPDDWDRLVADPEYRPIAAGCAAGPRTRTLDELFAYVKQTPRDLNEHADYIRHNAASSLRVTAFVKRREWNVILAAARPQSLIVYQQEDDPLLREVHAAVKGEQDSPGRTYTTIVGAGADSLAQEIEPTDLLILDTVHSEERLAAELERHASKVSQRILVRGTGAFGETAEGGGAGLFHALRPFLASNPDWFVLAFTPKQYGLTMLSRVGAERPAPPVAPWPIGSGPGTELKKLIAELGINPSPSCDCNAKAENMDRLGVDGCKKHREEIVQGLRENAPRWGWMDKVKAAALAVAKGIAFKLDVTDPYGSLVDLAISRAEQAAKGN